MRIGHLTDSEIQLWLDFNASEQSALSKDRAREVGVHLDNCYECREEVQSYADFMNELQVTPSVNLSRSFARKVTLALPPFQESRRRSIRRLGIIWGAASLLLIGWILTRLDWPYLAGWATKTFIPMLVSVKGFLGLAWTAASYLIRQIPWPTLDLSLFERIQSLMVNEPGFMLAALVSGVALILMSTVDNLIAGNMTGRR